MSFDTSNNTIIGITEYRPVPHDKGTDLEFTVRVITTVAGVLLVSWVLFAIVKGIIKIVEKRRKNKKK